MKERTRNNDQKHRDKVKARIKVRARDQIKNQPARDLLDEVIKGAMYFVSAVHFSMFSHFHFDALMLCETQ